MLDVANLAEFPAPVMTDRLLGHIDRISLEDDVLVVRGWAWIREQPTLRLPIEVFEDDQIIVTTTAEILRADLAAAGIGDGAHGFECRIPDMDGHAVGRLRFLSPYSSEPLRCTASSELTAAVIRCWPPVAIHGNDHISGMSCAGGVLRGWYDLEDRPLAVGRNSRGNFLSVVVDGAIVWEGYARRHEHVLAEGRGWDIRTGFLAELPEPATRVREREVHVLRAEGDHLSGSPLKVLYGDHLIGEIDSIVEHADRLVVGGWCVNSRALAVPVALVAMIGDTQLARDEARLPRADLRDRGYETSVGGFELTIATPLPADLSAIEIFPGLSGWALARAAGARHAITAPEATNATTVCAADDEIEGTVDAVTPRFVRGWARNKTNPHAQVVLDLFLNGVLYATTTARRFRADLRKHFNDHGLHEYLFEVSPTATFDAPCSLQVEPRVGKSLIKNKAPLFERTLPPKRIIAPRHADYLNVYRWRRQGGETAQPSIAMVIVNRNGADLLQTFFASLARVNTYDALEILIVDHDSTDDSHACCQSWSKRLPIRFLPRHGNYSFSQSCNYGARQTGADLVIFANNDLIFSMDALQRVAEYMSDPRIGVLGIRLMDDNPVKRRDRQSAIQHLGVHFDNAVGTPSGAFESRYASAWETLVNGPVEVPSVTGAYLVCRRAEFLALGGFDELFFYGHEDIDLCLKYRVREARIVCANDIHALHARAVSRDKMTPGQLAARQRNRVILDERFGFWFRRQLREDLFDRPGFWSTTPVRIAFVVTEATENTLAGDYFTALELAAQLSALFPCECSFLEMNANNQYDLAGYDVLIAMLDNYDPVLIKNATPTLLKVAWVRNWFDRFSKRPAALLFDRIWASSPASVAFLAAELGKPVQLLPIATNIFRFEAGRRNEDLVCDYCFTGSYWGVHREIISLLQPAALPFSFSIFGTGWERIGHLAPFSRGPLPYRRMPEVYASTRVVIDDANHVTKSWGAVNSRVFDAIAAGALVLTNGSKGSQDLFDGALPVFETAQQLEELLWMYLGNEEMRLQKVAELKALVRKRHTYQLRARTVWTDLTSIARSQVRVGIKIGAPNEKVKHEWGDWHFAMAMKKEFERLGHTARVDCIDAWDAPAAAGDDVVIVLRGLTSFKPKPHQINFLWSISHPDSLSRRELGLYDHVFVASVKHAAELQAVFGDKVSVLLQCTDPARFNPDCPVLEQKPGCLFVGNSRNEYRKIVQDAVKVGLPIEVYGSRWEGFLSDHYVKGEYIDNEQLGSFYRSAKVVLNDHWETMAAYGYVSNRVFDAVACGARVISDQVPGLTEIFGDAVATYETAEQLAALVESLSSDTTDKPRRRRSASNKVREQHSFKVRVSEIMGHIECHAAIRQRQARVLGSPAEIDG